MKTPAEFTSFLETILEKFACQTGSIHRTAPDGVTLRLVAHIGIPESLLDRVSSIPFGKGIAGVAAETRQPVELCNLQQDLGGVAKPDARQTGVSGSLAVPIFDEATGAVAGTLGIGKFQPYDFTAAEKDLLAAYAAEIARHFGDD